MNIRCSQFNHKMKLKVMRENLVFKSFMYKEPSVLTLCPMAGKRRLHHNGGCTITQPGKGPLEDYSTFIERAILRLNVKRLND